MQGDGGEVALQRRPGRGRGYRALGLSLLSFLNIFVPAFFTAGSLSHSYKSSAAQGDFCPVYFSPCACVCLQDAGLEFNYQPVVRQEKSLGKFTRL